MPYCARVLGFHGDLTQVVLAEHEHAVTELKRLRDSDDFALSDLVQALQSLRDEFPGLKLRVAAQGEEKERLIFEISDGRLSTSELGRSSRPPKEFSRLLGKTELTDRAAEAPPVAVEAGSDAPLCRGSTKDRLALAQQLAKRRSAKDIPSLCEALQHPGNRGSDKTPLRKELYNALSWHETEEVRRVFLEGLRRENPDVLDTILYVLWRQETLLQSLPDRLGDAWKEQPRDEEYVDRLVRAIRGAEGLCLAESWKAAAEPLLLRRLGLTAEQAPGSSSLAERIGELVEGLADQAPWFRGICRAISWESPASKKRLLLSVRDRLLSLARTAGQIRTRQLALELLRECGVQASVLAELADGLPETGPLRDLLGTSAEELPERRIAWRRESSAFSLVWLEKLGCFLADDSGGVTLLDRDGGERDRRCATLPAGPGIVQGCATTRPVWVGGLDLDGPKLGWIAVTGPGALSLDRALPIPHGVAHLVAHGDGVLCTSWNGVAYRARATEVLWTFRAPGGEARPCQHLDPHVEHAFVYSRDGLHCLEATTGAELWVNPKVQAPAEGTAWSGPSTASVAERASGIVYLGQDRVYRLDRRSGETLATLDIPLGRELALLPSPELGSTAPDSPAPDSSILVADGTTYLEELVPSGCLWLADGTVQHLTTPLLGHRCRRRIGEAALEISATGLFVSDGAGRWYAVPDLTRVGAVGAGTLVLWRKSSPVWGKREWVAVR